MNDAKDAFRISVGTKSDFAKIEPTKTQNRKIHNPEMACPYISMHTVFNLWKYTWPLSSHRLLALEHSALVLKYIRGLCLLYFFAERISKQKFYHKFYFIFVPLLTGKLKACTEHVFRIHSAQIKDLSLVLPFFHAMNAWNIRILSSIINFIFFSTCLVKLLFSWTLLGQRGTHRQDPNYQNEAFYGHDHIPNSSFFEDPQLQCPNTEWIQ